MNTKYEYKVIYDMVSKAPEVSEATRERILNAHGADGWELVSVCAPVFTYKGECYCYYFKRLIS